MSALRLTPHTSLVFHPLSLLKTLFHLTPLPLHFNSTLLPTHIPQSRPDHRLFQASGANGCLAQPSSGWRGLVRICARAAPPGESGVRDSRDSLATVLLGCQGGVKAPHPIVSLAPTPTLTCSRSPVVASAVRWRNHGKSRGSPA